MSKKAVATKSTNELAVANDAFSEYAGSGFEGVTSADLLIPRITILQSLSPQVDENKSEFIEGAKRGEICDIAMREVWTGEAGILVAPVKYLKQYIEWAPRSSGKGLVAIHSDRAVLDGCNRDERNRPINAAGNLVQETAQFFVYNLSSETPTRAFIPMASTQLKKARGWMNLAMSETALRSTGEKFTPPLFYRTYKLTSVRESNNDGDWHGWRVDRGPTLPEFDPENWRDLMAKCVEFRDSIEAGDVRADLSEEEETSSGDDQVM